MGFCYNWKYYYWSISKDHTITLGGITWCVSVSHIIFSSSEFIAKSNVIQLKKQNMRGCKLIILFLFYYFFYSNNHHLANNLLLLAWQSEERGPVFKARSKEEEEWNSDRCRRIQFFFCFIFYYSVTRTEWELLPAM